MRDEFDNYEQARAAEQAALRRLHEAIREAKEEGQTVAQIMEATGYSRRRVFQILSESKAP